ncbi:MAG: type II toxin-antitoxin system prevent-host-death family antitoxin [Desulfurivibrio sp.]|jgi:prevent-host-death family protein|nr:MAG: type II toxin-antitoxin system prevent-host-death family antitoxin [Desulfurivibrio sp.]
MSSRTVGIREAKANLSKYLRSIRQGNEIIITDRGRPIGKIVPIQPEELPLAARLQRLVENGLIETVRPALSAGRPAPPIPLPDELAQRLLQEDRGHD